MEKVSFSRFKCLLLENRIETLLVREWFKPPDSVKAYMY